ncbi:Hypothetical Protein RRSL_00165 [Ralstonia solanacearum UW551]|uniref:Transposase n=1 Tax=Ralstonia solanacearum (strain UW551) TaxID=342110 RepID=A0AB33V7C6_RALSU|nr:Hypothetical Protein RRSL_00165 [Ralstonia solanacearum UW551]
MEYSRLAGSLQGLGQNTAQLFSLFGLANLVLARRQLLASPGSIAS